MKNRPAAGVARAPAPGDVKKGQVPDKVVPKAGTVGAVAAHYLSRQLDAVLDVDRQPSSAGRVPDGTVAALRRIEAAVTVFYPIFESGRSAELSEELGWVVLLLGEARAQEVLADRLSSRLGALPEQLVLGPVRTEVEWRLDREQAVHLERVGAALASARYQQLLELLGQWRANPPLSRKAEQPGSEVTRHVTRAVEDFDGQLTAALLDDAPDQTSLAWQAARRVRYAAEVSDKLGRKLTKRIAQARRLEALLDELMASLHAARFLGRVGLDGEHNGFTYGLLHEQELQVAAAVRARLKDKSR